jgi:hypothetical protein
MDPNANLERQLILAQRIVDSYNEDGLKVDAEELADLVLALNEWIKKGGFLPKEWKA